MTKNEPADRAGELRLHLRELEALRELRGHVHAVQELEAHGALLRVGDRVHDV